MTVGITAPSPAHAIALQTPTVSMFVAKPATIIGPPNIAMLASKTGRRP